MELTARQNLERRGAFFFLIAYGLLFIISFLLQLATKLPFAQIVPGIVVNSFNMIMAFIIFSKKKRGKKSDILPWIIGFISVCAPMMVKFNYAVHEGWAFAVQSTNTSIMMAGYAVMLYLFYQPNLYWFYSVLSIINWVLFLYIAYRQCAEIHFVAHINGVPVTSGLILMREIFLI